MSMQIARQREIFKYYSTFYSLVVAGGLLGAIKKKPAALIPSLPLDSFVHFNMMLRMALLWQELEM